ncbi:GHMP kinase [bacterium]|nr:GHMP kinase [bacterium]
MIFRAPVRIDFAGGFTDVEPYSSERGGAVVNATIGLYSYISLDLREGSNIKLVSLDYDLSEEARSIREMEYNGNLDLLKAGLKRLGMELGGEVQAWCEAPPGAGLGASAATAVCLIYAIYHLMNKKASREEIAEMAHSLEIEELGIWGGKQDQYASALGGFLFLEFTDRVRCVRLKLREEFIKELEQSLLLFYTGTSRLSGKIVGEVMERYKNEKEIGELLDEMKEIAYELRHALEREDIADIGRLLSHHWERQKRLLPEIGNVQIDEMFRYMKELGGIGGKVLGAGGGGCILFVVEKDRRKALEEAISEKGCKLLPVKLVKRGVMRGRERRKFFIN